MLLRICFSLSLSLDNKETIGSTSARCRIKLETDLTVARLPCLIFDLVLRLLRQLQQVDVASHHASRDWVGLGGKKRWAKSGIEVAQSRESWSIQTGLEQNKTKCERKRAKITHTLARIVRMDLDDPGKRRSLSYAD